MSAQNYMRLKAVIETLEKLSNRGVIFRWCLRELRSILDSESGDDETPSCTNSDCD